MEIIGGSLPKGAEITSFLGSYSLSIPDGFLKSKKIKLKEHLTAVEHITEENKYSILGKAGWGALGGLVLGPVGALAGIVLGGNSKEVCCACKIDSGEEFLVSCTPEEAQKLKALAMSNPARETMTDTITIEAEPEEDVYAAIEKLGRLRDQGIVTEEEFNEKKAELMARI